MGFFRDYTYGTKQVTAICTDTNGGNFVWVAFAQNSGNCVLLKVSATDLNQVYFTVQVPVTSINDMIITNGQIFLAVTHATYFSFAYSTTTPLTSFSTMNKPVGITESPIAVGVDSSGFAYFLTPGLSAGTFASVLVTDNNMFLQEVLVMNQEGVYINNASNLTVDALDNIWVVTANAPSFLVRVWLATGGWSYQESNLI